MLQLNAQNDLFWKLLEPEYKTAMLYCRKLMQEREKGNDLFQDALVIAVQKFGQLKNHDAFRPWLYQVIINKFKSTVRVTNKRRWLPFTSESKQISLTENHPNRHIAKLVIEKLFKVISSEEQALIMLYEMEQWTIKELAELHKKSEGAIKLKLFRIRHKLKKEMARLSSDNESSFKELSKLVNVYVM